ncbi:hypothetical protein SAMN04244573_03201 [Azotobacter beijerinckii]|uniref:Phage late control gene D protein (GPD) n=1 Tax=Azotobacter beijerinckii TaxID=170623 RepID=A0A1H9MN86_9GAMM|nr:phage late control D family protein [Azotobacter beijerinckii]SER25162.1 hypothetical protein SAMN04244573_03201 [Azotobacter beijerinckii]
MDAAAYAYPTCRVVVDGRDITAAITQRLIAIGLTDNRGLEADTLDIQLSDHDGRLAIPPRGATVQLWLGWSDTGLTYKGSYTVDETEHSGSPDVLSIRARSADLREGLKTKRERSWDQQTLGDVIKAIASSNGLQPVIAPSFAQIPMAHLDQANESDANLLARLGEQHDAIATVKAGRLLFMPAGKSTTASGLPLPHITLTRTDGDQHRFLQADRDSYSGVRAYYYDTNSAEKKEAIAGGGDNLKDLRHVHTDQASALNAARAEWSRLQRGTATLSYSLARGRPDLIPELTYSLTGIKDEIAAITWLGSHVAHSFTADAYTTSLELESKLPDGEEILDLAEEATDYTGVLAWYRDEKTGKESKVTAGDQTRPQRLTALYTGKTAAEKAVEKAWKKMQASETT